MGPVSIKGRGAADNPQGRFESLARSREAEAEVQSRPETVVTLQRARSIIARNDSPDLPFAQSINPYQGCEHGCIYCYARPSHAYLGLSPGLEFETRLFAKENAAELLRRELSRPGYRCELIALGANTDPYQPIEREHRITRGILEVLWEFRNPVGIVTKGSLIERDLDLLEPMAREGLVQVFISIGSLDGEIARTLEPRAAAPYRRVETVRRLSERFKDWLERHYPLKAKHVMARIRDMRDGRDNDPRFGSRMKGEGQYAELLRKRFDLACKRLNLNAGGRNHLDTTKFRRPAPPQENLF